MSQSPIYRFNVIDGVGSAVIEGVETAAKAVELARTTAARTGAPAFVRRDAEIVLSVLPTGVVTLDVPFVTDPDDPRGRLPHGAPWPDRHPLTGERLGFGGSAGGATCVDFIFETETGRHLRGTWHGRSAGWSWDVDELLAEERDPPPRPAPDV